MKNLVKGYFKRNLGDDLFLKILAERYPNEKFEVYSSDNVSDPNYHCEIWIAVKEKTK